MNNRDTWDTSDTISKNFLHEGKSNKNLGNDLKVSHVSQISLQTVTLRRYGGERLGVAQMASYRRCKNETCGTLIEFDSPRKFCCNACRQKHYRSRTKGRIVKHPFQAVKRCTYCGQTFTAKHPNKRCCSRAHKQALYREQKALRSQ